MITMSVDNASVNQIVNDIKRLDESGKKSVKQATEWAANAILKSLSAETVISPKRRKIITQSTVIGAGRNAKGRSVKGKNLRVKGVMMWRFRDGKSVEEFVQINLDKDVPVVHFTGRGNNQLVRLLKTGKVVSLRTYESMSKTQLARNSYLAFIRMSGLAKKSWGWMQRSVRRGGVSVDSIGGKRIRVGSISWFGDNLTIHNRLSYATDSLRSKESSVNTAIENGAKSFKWKVDELLGLHEIKTT